MQLRRNFTRRSYQTTSKRAGTIATVTIVAPDKGHPFVCPLCMERDDEKEYLRIYLAKSPNAVCVHSKCLVNVLLKRKLRKHGKVMYVKGISHGLHEGMRATGMTEA